MYNKDNLFLYLIKLVET